jgi:hypothetical protein
MYPIFSLISLPFALLLIHTAAIGWEDEDGFHKGIQLKDSI